MSKHYTGVKPLSTIRAQCAQQGVAVDDWAHRKFNDDYIYFGRKRGSWGNKANFVDTAKPCWVGLHVANGRLVGRNMKDEWFTSADIATAHEPWFQALLDFFYVEG